MYIRFLHLIKPAVQTELGRTLVGFAVMLLIPTIFLAVGFLLYQVGGTPALCVIPVVMLLAPVANLIGFQLDESRKRRENQLMKILQGSNNQ